MHSGYIPHLVPRWQGASRWAKKLRVPWVSRFYILKIQQGIVKIKLIYAGNLHITALQRLPYQMQIFETDTDQRTWSEMRGQLN